MDQFNFFGTLFESIIEIIDTKIFKMLPEQEPSTNPDRDNCESLFFEKIKFLKNSEEYHQVEDNYDEKIISDLDYFIWLDLKILQASTKEISERTSTQILDFLGEVGGFQGSLIIILYLFGDDRYV